jgi:cysteine desulfurase / selenocysteine lyase
MSTAAAIDVAALRADFPILSRRVHGAPLVYLDSAATSQKPTAVLEAMEAYYRETNANVHRGVYELAAEATARFEAGRDAVARLVGAPREGVVFAKNASEAINLVAWAWGARELKPGDEVLVAEITGATVRFAPVTPGGELDMDALRGMLSERTRLVGVVHVSNVLGTINPVAEVARLAHDVGALCLVDGSQAVPQMPVDVPSLGCDFYAFTGHKMLGPTGIGCLAGTPAILDAMGPFLGGGEMISNVTTEGSTWADLPWKFEAGTPPIAEAVGLGAAAEYLAGVGMEAVRAHEMAMAEHMIAALSEVEGITIYGPRDPRARGAAVSFSLPDLHPHDIAQLIDREGVCIRAGHHCAKPLMRVLGVAATARASAYVYNSHDEIDALVRALASARAAFG